MRVKITTTIDSVLWEALQVSSVEQKTTANVILERLIGAYLKNEAAHKRGPGSWTKKQWAEYIKASTPRKEVK